MGCKKRKQIRFCPCKYFGISKAHLVYYQSNLAYFQGGDGIVRTLTPEHLENHLNTLPEILYIGESKNVISRIS